MLNSAPHFELWYAIPSVGLVMNDLNFRLAAEELRFICDDSQIRVLFVDDTLLPIARQLAEQVASTEQLVWTGPGTDVPDGTVAYEAFADTALAQPLPDDVARSSTLAVRQASVFLSWPRLAVTLVAAVVAGFGAAAWPAFRVSRVPTLELVSGNR